MKLLGRFVVKVATMWRILRVGGFGISGPDRSWHNAGLRLDMEIWDRDVASHFTMLIVVTELEDVAYRKIKTHRLSSSIPSVPKTTGIVSRTQVIYEIHQLDNFWV